MYIFEFPNAFPLKVQLYWKKFLGAKSGQRDSHFRKFRKILNSNFTEIYNVLRKIVEKDDFPMDCSVYICTYHALNIPSMKTLPADALSQYDCIHSDPRPDDLGRCCVGGAIISR